MSKIQKNLILAILFLLPVYLFKIKFGWISFNALELLITILFLIWFFIREKKYPAAAGPRQGGGLIQNTKYQILVLLIFIGLTLSVIVNKNFYSGLGAIKGWFLFPIVFAVIFYDQLRQDDSLLKKALLALFFSGVAVSVVGVACEIFGFVTFDDRLKIFWDSPNQLAMFLAVPFLLGIFFASQEKNINRKIVLALSFLLIGLNLYFTFSFGAYLAVAVALAVYFWLKYGKMWQKKYLLIFLIILVFLGFASFSKFKSLENLGDRSSLASRMMIWQSSERMIKNNPLFGIGPGNFQNKYLEYQKYFPPYLEWSAPQPHNIFLAFWLESGLLGLVGFIFILYYFFRDNKIAIKNNRDFGILFLAMMLYVLVHGLVDTTYWRNDLAVVFWMVVTVNFYLARLADK